MTPARLETFADGVFAIAATLLILNVDNQIGDRQGALGDRLLHIWPSYVAYGVSFLTIGIMWMNHHTVLSLIDHPTRENWNPGAGGMCTHSIQFEPGNDETMYVGISAAGVFRSEDGGESWIGSTVGIPNAWRNTTYWVAFDPDVRGRMWGQSD